MVRVFLPLLSLAAVASGRGVGGVGGGRGGRLSAHDKLMRMSGGKLSQAGRGAAAQRPPTATARLLRIGFQGSPGAYSEKAVRKLLGPHVLPVGHESFDDTFRALVRARRAPARARAVPRQS